MKKTPEEVCEDFFGGSGKLPRKRFPRVKPKGKGLQYKIQLKVRKKARKIGFKPRVTDDTPGNGFEWSMEDAVALHSRLLTETIATIRSCGEKRSVAAAEAMAWVERKGTDLPFSFEKCCELFDGKDKDGNRIGAQDPDILRAQLRRFIRKTFGTDLPHARVLREGVKAAEAGDTSAQQWITSESDDPLAFNSCCAALGFDPIKARQEIHWPHAQRACG